MTEQPNSPFENDDLNCGEYRLRLYVTGATPNSARAIVNLKEFCETHLKDNYELEIIDVYQQPLTAEADQVIAIPMLIKLASLAAECPTRCETFVGDVRDDAAVAEAVRATVERLGGIDVLFNNAGICFYGLAHELTEAEWDAMLDINLKGPWIVARHVIPHMIAAGRGVIVNNSSIAGLRGMARLSHYAASKWGLTGLTKSWAIELAPHGIRVVSIHPTAVDTPLNDGLAALEGATPQEIAERSAGNLLPVPWIEAADVAEANGSGQPGAG